MRKPNNYEYARNQVPLKLDGKYTVKPDTIHYDVDTGFYSYFDSRCIGLNLRLIGDVRDTNYSETFLRTYRNEDGSIIAAAFSIKTPESLREIYGDYINVNEMNSETMNGIFLITSTADFSEPIKESPKIKKVFLHYGADIDSIYSVHFERIKNSPDLRKINTLEDVINSAEREQAITKEFRKGDEKISTQEVKELDENLQDKLKSIK